MIMELSAIREALADRRMSVIADALGVHQSTVAAIRDGKNLNPTYGVYRGLSDYLQGFDD